MVWIGANFLLLFLGGDAKEGVESNLIKQTATQKFGVINLYFYSASVHLTDQKWK